MSSEHVDVLIVGAGLSGVGAACHLGREHPAKSYAILEARESIGGTWDLFRYPGVRSDSDMHTLGYAFRPWREAKAIADGPSILRYVRETAREHDVERHIRFGHRAVRAEWSSADARWTVTAELAGGGRAELTCGFLFMCSGYYRYDRGYTPELPGVERFGGTVVHPQHWPEDLDHGGRRVVVIGSGATAVTLVPAMAERAAHVTMLQRSPSYIVTLPSEDPLAHLARRWLPEQRAYAAIRWKNVAVQGLFFQLSRRRPRLVKALIRRGVERHLPPGFDTGTHFRPRYDPWDQRVCLVPDADLFEALSSGRASMATDEIETFTETGVRLRSGRELPADIVVTATGLDMLPLGGIELAVDGGAVDIPSSVGYKGMMLAGVPNMAMAFGYTNASWTLKADLTCEWVCRLLGRMDAGGHTMAVPRVPGPEIETRPFVDLASGYVQRSQHRFPRQGTRAPWRLHQNYARDIMLLRRGPIEDGVLELSAPDRAARGAEPVAA